MIVPAEGRWSGQTAAALFAMLGLVLSACLASPSRSGTPSAPPVTLSPSVTPSASPQPSGSPAPTPEPPLSLAIPRRQDRRVVSVRIEPSVPRDGDGRIVVTVQNRTDRRVRELVLRW